MRRAPSCYLCTTRTRTSWRHRSSCVRANARRRYASAAHASDLSGGFSSASAVLAAKAANDAIAAAANAKPRPPSSILYNPPALSGEEEAEVDDALGGGSANEKLAEFENIRPSVRTCARSAGVELAQRRGDQLFL